MGIYFSLGMKPYTHKNHIFWPNKSFAFPNALLKDSQATESISELSKGKL